MIWTSYPVSTLRGNIRAPGDKSCSHRALIMGALANGESRFTGLLEGEDVLATAGAMRAIGAEIEQTGKGQWQVTGRGITRAQGQSCAMDFGNSGTGARLIMGVAAGLGLRTCLSGDASLSVRPMNRVLVPLRAMGAKDNANEKGTFPFELWADAPLQGMSYRSPMASAQVKSAVLLAGLLAQGETELIESKATRDHTERMLRGFGVTIRAKSVGTDRHISIKGGQTLEGLEASIPGDPSSAAFLLAAGMISPNGEVLVENTLSNATRDGFFRAVGLMGGELGAEDIGEAAGEHLIDLQSHSVNLRGVEIPETLVPSMIDEFPILAVIAAFAKGETHIRGADELRVKESDRIDAVVKMLRVNGIEVEERPDGFTVQGCDGPPPGGGLVETLHDHRIAMSALVLGSAAQNPVSVDDISMIDTSYPEFISHMRSLGAKIDAGQP